MSRIVCDVLLLKMAMSQQLHEWWSHTSPTDDCRAVLPQSGSHCQLWDVCNTTKSNYFIDHNKYFADCHDVYNTLSLLAWLIMAMAFTASG